ncbi:hypothetical protein LWF01_17030 [Saxibacter everestensis]|uniref:RAMA domain-containing protein n=1 Tax=Saxibacter everestensis TaxID=2909229 RepID=A0ABY8QRZ6_9MICO|nr:hypothetical protein LWF01_17030 [Brevibacteriaceae bacterium ZFBP1038]
MYTHIEGEASAVLTTPTSGPAAGDGIHVEFQGWLGDDLLDLAGHWIVTGRLADALRASPLTGFRLEPVHVSWNPQWDLMLHEHELPDRWERLVPIGSRSDGDDYVNEMSAGGLLVSEPALELLRSLHLEQAVLTPVTAPPLTETKETERLRRARALHDEARARADEERAQRQSAQASADRDRDRRLAEALQRHQAEYEASPVPTGAVDLIRAALGHPIDDDRVARVLALTALPLEVETFREGKSRRHEMHKSPREGFDARFLNDKLVRVVIHPSADSELSRTLIDGIDLSRATPCDVVALLGAPSEARWKARGTQVYAYGRDKIIFGSLGDQMDSVVLMRARRTAR